MTNLHIPVSNKTGKHDIINSNDDRLQELSFSLLTLETGEECEWKTGAYESVFSVLIGTCTITTSEQRWENVGERQNVFDGRCHAIYLPPDETVRVSAKSDLEVAIPSSPTSNGPEPYEILPEANVHHQRGGKGFRRDVYDVLGPDDPANKLLVGETVNKPGNWSSYPPHKHDKHNPPEEADLEEIYFFRIRPKNGFAYQRIYTNDKKLNESYAVAHNDAVLIPEGYHPVSAPPGFEVYYFWVLAGNGRKLQVKTDPDFEHL